MAITRHTCTVEETIDGMAISRKFGAAEPDGSKDPRTPEQRAWDSAVMACAEFYRRRSGNEDEIYAGMHRLMTPTPGRGDDFGQPIKPQ